MGYSASTPCKSKKAQEEMLTFLQENMRREMGNDRLLGRRYMDVLPSSSLKYARGACGVGFDSPRDYEFAILRWVALRVGKRRKFRGLDRAVPWVNCDDQASEPVLLRSEWPNATEEQQVWLVDEHGHHPVDPSWFDGIADATSLINVYCTLEARIEAELHRLSALWSARIRG